MKRFPLLLLILMLFLCMKCEDYLAPEGMETSVYGTVYDSINDIPVTGIKVKIEETNRNGFYSKQEFIQFLDSTYTDAYGNYSLNFRTTGKGDTYNLVFERTPKIWTNWQGPVEVEPSEEVTEKDFNFLHLYPAVLNIRVEKDVKHLPLGISRIYNTSSDLSIEKSDTVYRKRIFIDKNSDQSIKFYRNISLNKNENFIYIIPATETPSETEYDISIRESDFE